MEIGDFNVGMEVELVGRRRLVSPVPVPIGTKGIVFNVEFYMVNVVFYNYPNLHRADRYFDCFTDELRIVEAPNSWIEKYEVE